MLTAILILLVIAMSVFIVSRMIFNTNDTPIFYHEQVLLVDLIHILTQGTPRDMQLWILRAQEYPTNPPRYDSMTRAHHHGTYLRNDEMSRYGALLDFVDERYKREQGKSLSAVQEELEQIKLRQANELEFTRRRLQQEFELQKEKDEQALNVRYKQLQQDIERDVPKLLAREQEHKRQLEHTRWNTLMRMISSALSAILMAQEELRKNPAARDVVEQLGAIYDELKKVDPAIMIDEQRVTEIVEQVMLRNRGYADAV